MRLAALLIVPLVGLLVPGALKAQSQAEINGDAEDRFEKVDAKLNAVYKKLLSSLDNEGKKKLQASERAWLAYRDAEAEYEADAGARGGSMAPMIYAGTEADLTKKRILELQSSQY